MNRKYRLAQGLFALCGVTALFVLGCGGGSEPEGEGSSRLQLLGIVSGGQQGIYYPSAIQFSNIFNENIEGVKVNVETSGGSVANARLLGNQEADLATMQNDIAYFAVRGEGMFDAPLENLRGITALYPELVQIVARKDAGINSIEDLRGKKVSIGAAGSGTELNARQILEAHGISLEDLALTERLKNTEASDKLKDSHIEAAFLTYGLGAPVIMDMAVTTEVIIVPIASDKVEAISQQYPYYTGAVIPAGTYRGVDADASTVSVMAWLVGRAGLEEDIVYQMTKSLYEHIDVLHGPGSPAKLKSMSLENAQRGLSIELHPGAKRYYDEKG